MTVGKSHYKNRRGIRAFLFPAVDGAKNEQEGIVNFNEDD